MINATHNYITKLTKESALCVGSIVILLLTLNLLLLQTDVRCLIMNHDHDQHRPRVKLSVVIQVFFESFNLN